jgi:hypothetical protein
LNSVKFRARHTAPRLPPTKIDDLKHPTEEETGKILDLVLMTKLPKDSAEAKERSKNVRELQYARWSWIKDNMAL